MVSENRSKEFSVTLSGRPECGEKRGADLCGDRCRRWDGERAVEVRLSQTPLASALQTSGVRKTSSTGRNPVAEGGRDGAPAHGWSRLCLAGPAGGALIRLVRDQGRTWVDPAARGRLLIGDLTEAWFQATVRANVSWSVAAA
jgi:hypothetical protein